MWTPKRILILIAGLALFCCAYGVYAFFLSEYDGLPQLPAVYADPLVPTPIDIEKKWETNFEKKLRMAFGDGCPEVNRSIKLDFIGKGYGLAANRFEPEPDGRIKLSPFSAFMIPKRQDKNSKIPEINTIRCDVAYLTLDHPINSMAELGNRKIIAVQLCRQPGKPRGKDDPPDITIKNNRGTPEESDDVELTIIDGDLFFYDDKNLIETKGLVKLFDPQSGKDPTTVTATGMEIYLTKDNPSQGKAAAKHRSKKKGEAITGVDKLILLSQVTMHLFVDSRSGFLGNPSPKPAAGSKEATEPETSHLIIRTAGSFTYDLPKDLAWYDSPKSGGKESFRDQVLVQREHKSPDGDSKKSTFDEVKCDHLELQFRRKTDAVPAENSDSRSINKDIESARATARTGDMVDLVMPTEKLHARSLELEYFCATAERGAKIVLKGQPLMAAKEGHELHCQELVLIAADKNGNGQTASAKGPGQFDMFDKSAPEDASENRKFPWKAVFKDSLVSTKDRVGNKILDLLTLSGDAAIIDEEHKQSLQAQRLLIWLEPDEQPTKTPQPATENSSGSARQKPNKLEGFEEVKMFSPEINILRADHLKVYFTEELAPDDRLPAVLPEQGKPGAIITPFAGPSRPGQPDQNVADKDGKQKQPIDLEARDVVAYVTRLGASNYLRELVTEGTVHVNQKGNTPQDKGVDIQGDMLNLLHHPQGDILYVFGDTKKQAQLQLGELNLAGPKVTINQKDNMAQVEGIGFMEMPSNAAFDGGKPTKPGTRLTVHWNDGMLFDGKYAEFKGGVVAYQEDASLRSQNMQVTLDRAVSFKEGQKEGQNAKVEILSCDGKVFIVEEKKDAKGNREKYYRLDSTQVRLDNTVELVNASGPGKVIVITTGSDDQTLANPRPQPGTPPPTAAKIQELQLTRIDFLTRMYSNNKENVRVSKFYDNVEIYHAPGDRPDMKMDADHPPKGGFYMRCDLLEVYTMKIGQDKTSQIMDAKNKVTFRTQEFFGNASSAKYNESQELMIFEGTAGNPAKLYQFVPNSNQTREIVGMKILYNRRTGGITIEGAKQIEGR